MTETTNVYTEVRIGPRSLGSPVSIGPEKFSRRPRFAEEASAQPGPEAQTGRSQQKGNSIGRIIAAGYLIPYQDSYVV